MADELNLDDPAVQDHFDDRILDELRGIRADLKTERSTRQTLTRVVGVLAAAVFIIACLTWSAYLTHRELSRQGDALAAVVAQNTASINSNDYNICVNGNEFRVEFKELVVDLTDGLTTSEATKATVHALLDDPNSKFGPRDCSALPH